MKKTVFTISMLFLLFLFARPSFADDSPSPHTVATLNEREASAWAETVYAREKLFVFYSSESDNKLVMKSYRLNGALTDTRTFKGYASALYPQAIRADADGQSVAVVWREDADFGARLFVAVTTDGANFNEITVASGNSLSPADIAVRGNRVVVVYRQGNTVYARKSIDGGASFSAPEVVFQGNDVGDRPYQVEVEISDSLIIGVSFAFEDYTVDSSGNESRPKSVYYAEGSFSSSSWVPTKIFSNDADTPGTDNLYRPLSIAFDDAGSPYVAWCSGSSTGKIYYARRSGNSWSSSSFSSLNSNSSSVKLLSNKALFSPGLMLCYTRGANTQVYYRFFSASGIGYDEKNFSQLGNNNTAFLSATTFFGHTAILNIKMPDSSGNRNLVLNFEEILVSGRTGKFRYKLWSEGFENSDVNNNGYWQISTDPGAAGARFAETSTYKYTGAKSLWSAGIGNVNGKYPANTATTARLRVYSPLSLNYELSFVYRFSNADDPDDQASAGFSSFPLTLVPKGNIWSIHRVFSNLSENMVQLRMISDSDSDIDVGLLVDDLELYGYKLRRPSITLSKVSSEGSEKAQITVSNYEGNVFYLFRSNDNISYQLVATSSSNVIYDTPPSTGYYYYFVVTSDGEFESPPSEIRSGYFTVDNTPPSIFIEGVEDGTTYTVPVTPEFSAEDANLATVSATLNGEPFTSGSTVSEDGTYTLCVHAKDKAGNESSRCVTFYIVRLEEIERIYGQTRIDTAVELSEKTFTTANAVVIATAYNFPDALAAAPLAHALSAPILLVKQDVVPASVVSEIQRLEAKEAYIIGGEGVISAAVEDQLEGLGLTVERIAGVNRYETAALVARKLSEVLGVSSFETAYIATGENFPDALAAGGVAARASCPILLVKKDAIPHVVSQAIEDLGILRTYILGGEGAVSSSVENALPNPARLAGKDRYETAVRIAEHAVGDLGFDISAIYVATGLNYPDALAAGACVARTSNPLLLVKTDAVPSTVADFISAHSEIRKIRIIGGPGAVSAEVEDQLERLIP